jgi:UDP-glucuronate 4-epimerase
MAGISTSIPPILMRACHGITQIRGFRRVLRASEFQSFLSEHPQAQRRWNVLRPILDETLTIEWIGMGGGGILYNENVMWVLVTGSAGFIGFHVAKALLERGDTVVGLDDFNDYYDPKLKEDRNAILEKMKGFTLIRGDVADRDVVDKAMKGVDNVCHLAAAAGVRHSIEHPDVYMKSNIVGFQNILEAMRGEGINRLVFASSSSVYGDAPTPFREDQRVTSISFYGATKLSNEAMAHAYHRCYGLRVTGLRFFTVYGPWGRPDMALFRFVANIFSGKPIDVFNMGNHRRDFTYVDDIAAGVLASIDADLPFAIVNLGWGRSEALMDFIALVEKTCGKKAKKNLVGKQVGDVDATHADITRAGKLLGYVPKTSIEEGMPRFVEWYRRYYNV